MTQNDKNTAFQNENNAGNTDSRRHGTLMERLRQVKPTRWAIRHCGGNFYRVGDMARLLVGDSFPAFACRHLPHSVHSMDLVEIHSQQSGEGCYGVG